MASDRYPLLGRCNEFKRGLVFRKLIAAQQQAFTGMCHYALKHSPALMTFYQNVFYLTTRRLALLIDGELSAYARTHYNARALASFQDYGDMLAQVRGWRKNLKHCAYFGANGG